MELPNEMNLTIQYDASAVMAFLPIFHICPSGMVALDKALFGSVLKEWCGVLVVGSPGGERRMVTKILDFLLLVATSSGYLGEVRATLLQLQVFYY